MKKITKPKINQDITNASNSNLFPVIILSDDTSLIIASIVSTVILIYLIVDKEILKNYFYIVHGNVIALALSLFAILFCSIILRNSSLSVIVAVWMTVGIIKYRSYEIKDTKNS